MAHTVSGAGPRPAAHAALTLAADGAGRRAPDLAAQHRARAGSGSDGRGCGGGRASVTVQFEQKGEIFDFPVTVRLRYASGEDDDVMVLGHRSRRRTYASR